MINFQIIKKRKKCLENIFECVSVFILCYIFSENLIFLKLCFKIQVWCCDLGLYVSNKFKTYSEIIGLNKV